MKLHIYFIAFSIALNAEDLSIEKISNETSCDPYTFETTGDIKVILKNTGNAINKNFSIGLFYDKNNNNQLDSNDIPIKKIRISDSFGKDSTKEIIFNDINTTLPFRDAGLSIMADINQEINENNENNNIDTTIDNYIIEECRE